MDTKEEKIKQLKNEFFTIQEKLNDISAKISPFIEEIIFTDIEPEYYNLLVDVELFIFMCRKKMNAAKENINKISDIIE